MPGAATTSASRTMRLATTHHSFLGSFSAVSKRNFATKYAFFQVFRDLQNYLADFLKKLHNFAKNRQNLQNLRFFATFKLHFATFSKIQLDSFVDLEKPEKMRIWSQNFVSIQPRTSHISFRCSREPALVGLRLCESFSSSPPPPAPHFESEDA